jgi:CBS domain-containing membrane protein
MQTAVHVMTSHPRTVFPGHTVRRARTILASLEARHLPVVDIHHHPVGMISDRDLRVPAETRVRDVMRAPVATAAPHTPLSVLAGLMLEDHVGAVAIVGASRALVGVVTYGDLLAALPAPALAAIVDDVMTTAPRSLEAGASVDEIAAVMQELGVRHVPIVDEDGELVGIVSDRDLGWSSSAFLEGAEARATAADRSGVSASDVMSGDVESVVTGSPLADVVTILRDTWCGAVPVIDGESRVVGIVSYIDVLRSALPHLDAPAPAGTSREPLQREA